MIKQKANYVPEAPLNLIIKWMEYIQSSAQAISKIKNKKIYLIY